MQYEVIYGTDNMFHDESEFEPVRYKPHVNANL